VENPQRGPESSGGRARICNGKPGRRQRPSCFHNPLAINYVHCEARSNCELCKADMLIGDCFVPRNYVVGKATFNKTFLSFRSRLSISTNPSVLTLKEAALPHHYSPKSGIFSHFNTSFYFIAITLHKLLFMSVFRRAVKIDKSFKNTKPSALKIVENF
jgi:hypothetical protein